MPLVRRIRAAATESVVVGVAVALVEATRAVWVSGRGSAGAWVVLVGLSAVGWSMAALAIHTAGAVVARVPVVAAWWEAARAGQARAIRRAGLAVVAVAAVAWIAFRVIAWVHVAYRFRDPEPVALLIVGVVAALAVVAMVAAISIDRAFGDRVIDVRGLGAGAALALFLAPIAIAARAVPAVSRAGIVVASLCVTLVVVARVLAIGERRRVSIGAAVVAITAIVVALSMGRSARGRSLAIEQGTASRVIARALLHLGDRDHDGYAGMFGGADCDDGDPSRNPGETDIPGNRLDENCTGADAPPVAVELPTRSHEPPPAGIILISVDALRADHLGVYGYRRATSPAIDAFAQTGARFATVFTSSPTTRHAVPSLLSGRYPTLHRPLSTLAEMFSGAGWDTVAVLCCDHLVGDDALRGFQRIDVSADSTRMARAGLSNADTVVDAALRFLAVPHAKPYFLWLHLYEPHHPYAAPLNPARFGDTDLDRYDGEIAFLDAQLARLFAVIPSRAVVALTADHGDEFSEHGIRFHARSLYNQVTRVPLIIRLPGAAPSVVTTPVSLVDIAPTLLELADLGDDVRRSGRSLAAGVHGARVAPRPFLVELPPDRTIDRDLIALVAPPWKLIWDREVNSYQLYRLDDVTDATDLSGDTVTVGRLRLELRAAIDAELAGDR